MTTKTTPLPDGGLIRHQRGTRLTAPRSCAEGHFAPQYETSQRCVVCAYIDRLEAERKANIVRTQRRMPLYSDYAEAREVHERDGGYLLDLGGVYGVTQNWRRVRELRGGAWLNHCERIECWDEVEQARNARGSRRLAQAGAEARA